MAEYIEREKLASDFEQCNSRSSKWTAARVNTLIARQNAADVSTVRHRRWECSYDYGLTACSACGWNIEEYVVDYAYCPHCGAKMDLEDG